jgi:NAD(P)H-dependent flavin oxidoreductase YrpB (nitropropane dioxygenase family)
MYVKIRALVGGVVLAAAVLAAGPYDAASAGEADDLQVMIDRARNGVPDLERQDDRGATRDETTVLRVWLDEAWRLRSEQRYDDVRIVLDRCEAQAELIRQKIQASKVMARAAEREEDLKRLRDNIEKTRRAIQQATLAKAALEARSK